MCSRCAAVCEAILLAADRRGELAPEAFGSRRHRDRVHPAVDCLAGSGGSARREIKINVGDHALSLLIRAGMLERRLNVNARLVGPREQAGAALRERGADRLFSTTEESWWNYVVCRTGGRISNTAMPRRRWSADGGGTTRGADLSDERSGEGTHRTMHSEREVFEFVGCLTSSRRSGSD
jgi:hypothetical protein